MEESEKTSELNALAQKHGVPVDQLTKQYNEKLAQLKKQSPGLSDDLAKKRAMILIQREFIADRSPAKPYDMIPLGIGPKRDITAGMVAEIMAMDREVALSQGKIIMTTDLAGNKVPIAIDTRATFDNGRANPNFNKPITPVFRRQSISLAWPFNGGDTKLLILTHQGVALDKLPTLKLPVRARINLRETYPDRYIANTSTTTKFVPCDITLNGKKYASGQQLDDGSIYNILTNAPESLKSTLANLMNWHDAHKGDARRVVIIEADIMNHYVIEPSPNITSSMSLQLADESIGYDENASLVQCWIPPEIAGEVIKIGDGSRVAIIGSTSVGGTYDRETRTTDRTKPRVMLNAYGVYADPMLLIPPEEEDIEGGL